MMIYISDTPVVPPIRTQPVTALTPTCTTAPVLTKVKPDDRTQQEVWSVF